MPEFGEGGQASGQGGAVTTVCKGGSGVWGCGVCGDTHYNDAGMREYCHHHKPNSKLAMDTQHNFF